MLTVNTKYSTYKDCCLNIQQYQRDMSPCIQIYNQEGPIAYMTVCIPNHNIVLESDESFIDTNNCPWAINLINKYNLGTMTDKVDYSGFCQYPVVKWNLEELNKHLTIQ